MSETTATLFIDGQWVASSDGGTRTVTCPADGSTVGEKIQTIITH
jgi:betaine-aldehyde dehydrogenase